MSMALSRDLLNSVGSQSLLECRRPRDGDVTLTGSMLTVFSILAGAITLFAWGRPRLQQSDA
jgi:hypothetical protein